MRVIPARHLFPLIALVIHVVHSYSSYQEQKRLHGAVELGPKIQAVALQEGVVRWEPVTDLGFPWQQGIGIVWNLPAFLIALPFIALSEKWFLIFAGAGALQVWWRVGGWVDRLRGLLANTAGWQGTRQALYMATFLFLLGAVSVFVNRERHGTLSIDYWFVAAFLFWSLLFAAMAIWRGPRAAES